MAERQVLDLAASIRSPSSASSTASALHLEVSRGGTMPGSSRGGRERQGATATGIITNEHGHSHTEALREILAEAAEAAQQQQNEGERCEAKAEKMTEELQCQSESMAQFRRIDGTTQRHRHAQGRSGGGKSAFE